MSLDLEGRIDVVLSTETGRIGSVQLCSSRPQVAQRLLAGRTPADAATLVGTLFSLCGRAQRTACEWACAVALGEDGPGPRAASAVLSEIAIEHAWRLLLDWPKYAEDAGIPGDSADPRVLAGLRREAGHPDRFVPVLVGLLESLLGEPPADWLRRGADGLDQWCTLGLVPAARLLAGERLDHRFGHNSGRRASAHAPTLERGSQNPGLAGVMINAAGELRGRSDAEPALPLIPALAELADSDLAELAAAAVLDPEFCARPRWHGGPAETAALARQRGRPMVAGWIGEWGLGAGARMLARLVELASIPVWLRRESPPLIRAIRIDPGIGVAAVETSRGLLIHVVRLADGRIAEYRIVAPTEWNCADDGPLATELAGLSVGIDLERRARLLIGAIDPCVACALEVRNA